MEIWSLTRYPEGEARDKPTPPEVWECDDPRWPPIPTQDFSNIPRQQKGLHSLSYREHRLATEWESIITNMHRELDRRLGG